MDRWVLVPNPAHSAGALPRILEPVCHDRTPFLTIQCTACRDELHVHESQIETITTDIEARCPACAARLAFPAGFLQRAIERLRLEGWFAPKGARR